MTEYKYIETSDHNEVTVVRLANPTIQDRLLINELGDELIDFVERQKPQKLIVDFERVEYCSSEVIGSLIRARWRVLADGGQIKLCSLNDDVRGLFRITNLDGTLFDIHDTLDKAVSDFS